MVLLLKFSWIRIDGKYEYPAGLIIFLHLALQCILSAVCFITCFRMMVAAMGLAETIAAMSPCAIQNTKLNLNYARDNKLEDSLEFAVSLNKF